MSLSKYKSQNPKDKDADVDKKSIPLFEHQIMGF